ncbi:hypothetical protein SISNIDRAFT_450284 [Sistotremastrum niveocremeum HHB9708]|uniref:Uncharacterized protein n=1 Tax=Sistotremastrum niveocremeum HHB9708 TaxID=1314777 RepID=A0A164Z292_9AGAM|nr:hypothetical protein SISNIDRAFT_450284 [Sistotremastrum niveocremeum HHB9708]
MSLLSTNSLSDDMRLAKLMADMNVDIFVESSLVNIDASKAPWAARLQGMRADLGAALVLKARYLNALKSYASAEPEVIYGVAEQLYRRNRFFEEREHDLSNGVVLEDLIYSPHVESLWIRRAMNRQLHAVYLPAEILCMIFERFLANIWEISDKDLGRSGMNRKTGYRPLLVISRVCSDWRNISLAMKSFWSRVNLNWATPAVATFAERAEGAPLHLEMGNPPELSETPRILDKKAVEDKVFDRITWLIIQSIRAAKTFNLHLTAGVIMHLDDSLTAGLLSKVWELEPLLLENITLNYDRESAMSSLGVKAFSNTPRIRRIFVNRFELPNPLDLMPLHDLTSFHFRMTPNYGTPLTLPYLRRLLSCTPNIEEMILEDTVDVSTSSDTSSDMDFQIVLSRCRKLVISLSSELSPQQLFSTIMFPHIEALSISCEKALIQNVLLPFEHLPSYVQDIIGPCKTLEIKGEQHYMSAKYYIEGPADDGLGSAVCSLASSRIDGTVDDDDLTEEDFLPDIHPVIGSILRSLPPADPTSLIIHQSFTRHPYGHPSVGGWKALFVAYPSVTKLDIGALKKTFTTNWMKALADVSIFPQLERLNIRGDNVDIKELKKTLISRKSKGFFLQMLHLWDTTSSAQSNERAIPSTCVNEFFTNWASIKEFVTNGASIKEL